MWPFTKRTKLAIQTVVREPVKLRLSEWMADENLTRSAGKVLLDPTFQLMMQVAKNESPAMMALTIGTAWEDRALHQARIEGYNMAFANLEAMGIHKPLREAPEATFEEEEKEL